jgi:hypothetical protein
MLIYSIFKTDVIEGRPPLICFEKRYTGCDPFSVNKLHRLKTCCAYILHYDSPPPERRQTERQKYPTS